MRYIFTETYQTCDPMYYTQDQSTVKLVERIDKHGAAILWGKQWFKTKGVNRTEQKRGKRRVVQPKEYAVANIKFYLNFHGVQDWNEAYAVGWLDEAYAASADYRIKQSGWIGGSPYGYSYHPEWGLAVVDIYSKKRAEWTRLWLRVEDDDGNEHIAPENPVKDEWV